MTSNPFNRSQIEQEKQWAKWLKADASTPSSTSGQQQGGEEPTMNPIEKVDGVISTMNEIKSDIGNYVAEEKATSYREGFQAGKDAIELPAPTDPAAQYTQQQMNDAVNSGKAEQRLLDEGEFGAQVKSLQEQIDGIPALIAQAKDEATTAAKTEFRQALEAQQAVESASEAELAAKVQS